MCRIDIAFQNIRPEPGNDPDKWNWKAMDTLRTLRKDFPDLDYLVLLGYGPAWAECERTRPAKPYEGAPPFNCPQEGITIMPPEDPRNLYGHYVYEMVKRYKDVSKFWESWNEPDLPGDAFFKGTGKDFFAYQKACYLAAKKADPECTVLFAGLCYGTIEGYLAVHQLKPPTPYPPKTCFFEEYLKECVKDPEAKQNHFYFDLMNQHSYTRASDLFDYVAINNKLMQDYLGEVKPTWITEMGITDTSGPGFDGTPNEYCDYVLQSFAWGRLAGVERFFHFQLDNSNGCGLYQGMLGPPKPVLTAYRDVLAKELAEARFVEQLHGSRGVGFLDGHSAYDRSRKTGYALFEFQRPGDGADSAGLCRHRQGRRSEASGPQAESHADRARQCPPRNRSPRRAIRGQAGRRHQPRRLAVVQGQQGRGGPGRTGAPGGRGDNRDRRKISGARGDDFHSPAADRPSHVQAALLAHPFDLGHDVVDGQVIAVDIVPLDQEGPADERQAHASPDQMRDGPVGRVRAIGRGIGRAPARSRPRSRASRTWPRETSAV